MTCNGRAATSVDGHVDIVIVGCGPVGLTLAVLLGQLGRTVAVLERWPDPYPLPRAVHFDHEVGRILQSCGIGEQLRLVTEQAGIYEWRNADGLTLLRFGGLGDSPSGWPQSSMVHQPTLEALLEQRADELPNVTIRRGVEVVDVEQGDDAVTVRTADRSEVRGSYVIGCDGANSTVRTVAQLPVKDLGFFYDWLIVDVILNAPRVFDPQNLQVCDPLRPTTAVSGGPGRRRWEFMRLPHESREALDEESRAWELLADWDVHPGNAQLERHTVYTFNASYAEQWRAGRILLAGDAAHLMPPFAGQGMCSGIRDAANLAWKLDVVLRDLAGDALLDTYQVERLPHVRGAIDFSVALGKVICVPDVAEAAERDATMSAMVNDELPEPPSLPCMEAGLIASSSPHAGHLFLQGTIDGQPSDDAVGVGWRLVTDRAESIGEPALSWFESIDGKVVHLAAPDATYRRWFDEHDAHFALQRPDFALFGTATNSTEATALVETLRTHLGEFGGDPSDRSGPH